MPQVIHDIRQLYTKVRSFATTLGRGSISQKVTRFARKSPSEFIRDFIKFARKPRYERRFIVRRYFGTWDWRYPRRGNDRTLYIIGLFGSGRGYLNGLILRNFGQRANYFRETIRFHPNPTSMIYSGHATIKYISREQAPPEVTSRILEMVRSQTSDLIFLNRHPLDSLLTNWVFWRVFIRDNFQIEGASQVYKSADDLCADLAKNFSEFKAFADGDPSFFAKLAGPRFLSLAEFVEEAELYCQAATLTLCFENFIADPSREFRKIIELLSLDVNLNCLRIIPPKAKAYGYLTVKDKLPQFRDFINELHPETKKRIENIGYKL
jgi:hypothetical protein